jgi:16S rRNA (guanine966-N2)-methyltransferase
MRITGGEWGGRTLFAPKGPGTRPTSDANRLALFNMLSHSFAHEMGNVLDLFAGSGALSFEALSRGADRALLFEKDRAALASIERNRLELGLDMGQVDVFSDPKIEKWATLIQERAKVWGSFQTIFCDPPYETNLVDRALKRILPLSCIGSEALIYVELGIRESTPEFPDWTCVKRRDRGSSGQCFYRRTT